MRFSVRPLCILQAGYQVDGNRAWYCSSAAKTIKEALIE